MSMVLTFCVKSAYVGYEPCVLAVRSHEVKLCLGKDEEVVEMKRLDTVTANSCRGGSGELRSLLRVVSGLR